MKKNTGLTADLGILTLVFLSVLLLNAGWLSLDPLLPGGDSASLLTFSVKVYRALAHLDLSQALFSSIDYPPLPFFYTALLYAVFGLSESTAYLGVTLWLAVLLPAMYFLGLKLGDRMAGLLSAGLCAFSAPVLFCSKTFLPDLPLLALTALAWYWLVSSQDFRRPRYTLYFFLTAALAMLTKVSFIFFIAAPFLFSVYRMVAQEKTERREGLGMLLGLVFGAGVLIWCGLRPDFSAWVKNHFYLWLLIYWWLLLGGWLGFKRFSGRQSRTWSGFILGSLIFAALVGPWYAGAMREFLFKADLHFLGWAQSGGESPGGIWLTYWKLLNSLLPWGMILPLIGIILGKDRRLSLLLILSALLGFVLTVSTTGYNPFPRYLIPALPYLALLGVLWLKERAPVLRIGASALILAALLWQAGGWILTSRLDYPDRICGVTAALAPQPCGRQYYRIAEEVYGVLKKDYRGKSLDLLVSETVEPGDPVFDALNFWAARDNLPLMIEEEPENEFKALDKLEECDYILLYRPDLAFAADYRKLLQKKFARDLRLIKVYNYHKGAQDYEIKLYKIIKLD